MPARKRIFHDENTRKKIQAAHIINRLTGHVMGELDLTASQVKAAEILLKKTLPDLQSTSIEMDVQGEMGIRNITVEGVASKDA